MNKLFKPILLSVCLLGLVGCAKTTEEEKTTTTTETTSQSVQEASLSDDQLFARENTMSVLWWQSSEEAKALYMQGYQVAEDRLKEIIQKPTEKPYSIVLDIDETVLDNSPYQAQNVKDGKAYNSEDWDEWVQKKSAKPVAGAKEFLQYANDNNVQIYYISDRTVAQIEPTIENLKNEGLPVQGKDHFLFLEEGVHSKEDRRKKVQENTNLVLLFGDNLIDFADFSKTSKEDREQLLNQLHTEFGQKFIIFPNPMYGSWETSVYGEAELDAKGQMTERASALQVYK